MFNNPVPIMVGGAVVASHSYEEERCPRCHKPEKIKEICAHCGYEYPEYEGSWSWQKTTLCVVGGIIGLWFIITIFCWLVDNSCTYAPKPTLLQTITGQWEFIKNLKIW